MVRKIAIVTGTRAEYGLLRPVITGLRTSPEIEVLLFVTGTHLSPDFGMTISEIEADCEPITERIEILLSSDSCVGTGKSMGLALIGFSEAFYRHKPDLVVLLGDRFEIFCAAAAATISRIPIAHIHGGELTEGAIDNVFRHAITKMSHLHFTATEEYRRRVIQMGELPTTVYNVGALGVEAVYTLALLTREKLEADLKIKLRPLNFLVTFHPETLSAENAVKDVDILLEALDRFPEALVLFTKANADTEGSRINARFEEYTKHRPETSVLFSSLGQVRYLSLLRFCSVIIGNSSSGIIEAPSLGVPTVNIGYRQEGRVKAESVLDCRIDAKDISCTIKKAILLRKAMESLNFTNPYYGKNTSKKIVEQLTRNISRLTIKKPFYQLAVE